MKHLYVVLLWWILVTALSLRNIYRQKMSWISHLLTRKPQWDRVTSVRSLRTHSEAPQSVRTSGQVIGPLQRPLLDNTQSSQVSCTATYTVPLKIENVIKLKHTLFKLMVTDQLRSDYQMLKSANTSSDVKSRIHFQRSHNFKRTQHAAKVWSPEFC